MSEPLYRRAYDARAIFREHPPRLHHAHKRGLFAIAYANGEQPDPATIEVTRWAARAPASVDLSREIAVDVRPDFFDYAPVEPAAVEWHVNFADPRLFYAYGSALFAQDEMQVAEHPLLACVREALVAEGLSAKTSDERGASPVLVTNVERRLAIDTRPTRDRPGGLYGNRFAAAPIAQVRAATWRVEPATRTNLIAIAAPAGGEGEYAATEIAGIFANAFTAFAAAVGESEGRPAIVHTGFWGCGAFGGNRRLMIALQTLAARAAGVARIVLHAGDDAGTRDANAGVDLAEGLARRSGSPTNPSTLAERAAELGLRWGVSDGN